MDEALEYKKYLKALKEMTKKKNTSASNFIKRRKQLAGGTILKMSEGGICRGMGAAVKGGNFKGVM